MRELLCFIICIFIISCKSIDQQKHHVLQIETNISTDESGNEIFESFYTYFVGDSIFQKNRTIIPKTILSPVYSDPEGVVRDTVWTVDNEKWGYIPIKKTTEVRIQGDTANLLVEILNNNGLDLFESQFYKKNGRWYLDLTTDKNKGFLFRLIRSS